jgi:hypothetical protein
VWRARPVHGQQGLSPAVIDLAQASSIFSTTDGGMVT